VVVFPGTRDPFASSAMDWARPDLDHQAKQIISMPMKEKKGEVAPTEEKRRGCRLDVGHL